MIRKYAASLLAIVVAIAAFAFTTPTPPASGNPNVIQVWQYSQTEPLSNAKNAALYSNITSGGGYSCSGSGNVCTVTFNTDAFPNLQAYLNSFGTPTAVRNASSTVQRN